MGKARHWGLGWVLCWLVAPASAAVRMKVRAKARSGLTAPSESALSLRAHPNGGPSPGSEFIELFTLLTTAEGSLSISFSLMPFDREDVAEGPSELCTFLGPGACGPPGCFFDLKRKAILGQASGGNVEVGTGRTAQGVWFRERPGHCQLHSHPDCAPRPTLAV